MEILTKFGGPFLIALLGAGYLYQRSRRQSSEAVVKNQESLKQVDEIGKKKDKIDLLLEMEFLKQTDIKKDIEKTDEKADEKSLVDFFNK